jgi:hypothetical protein
MKSLKQPIERRPQAVCRVLRDSTVLKISTQFVENDKHSGHPSLSRNEEEVAKMYDLVPVRLTI